MQETTKKLVEEVAFGKAVEKVDHLFCWQVINPYAKEWEAERIFPAHKVFKKFGEAGLLGISRS